jgi:molybdopterin converting factor subunit 1
MKITLRYFALWRELLGRDEEVREVAPGTTVGGLADEVASVQPRLAALRGSTMLMVNQEYAPATTPLGDGDEVAFIPPVSGGAARTLYRVVETPLDVREVIRAVEDPGAGAIVSFTGTVRDNSLGKEVTGLTYEAYPAAAEKMLARVGEEVLERWPVLGVAIIHRTGRLAVGEASVVIAVSAPRRHAAFEACEHVIVRLKEIVPIWKKEQYADGAVWIGSETDYPRVTRDE